MTQSAISIGTSTGTVRCDRNKVVEAEANRNVPGMRSGQLSLVSEGGQSWFTVGLLYVWQDIFMFMI